MLPTIILSIFLFFFFFFSVSVSNPDSNALLSFKTNSHELSNSLSSWVNSTDPCTNSWLGVTCNPTTHRVIGIVLENLNLTGSIHPLSQLTELRLLSLKHNHLYSSSSLNLSSWPNLKHLYLSNNRFDGIFPAGISHLRRLQRLDISHNNFSGDIPMTELTQLPRLLTVRLGSNSFTGTLNWVGLSHVSILDFDVSNNKLSGKIPVRMSRFPESSFVGNENLCGVPLPYNCSNKPIAGVSSVKSGDGGGGGGVMVLMTVTIVLVVLLAALVIVTCCVYNWKRISGGTHKERYGIGNSSGGPRGGGGGGGCLEEEEGMVVFEGWKGFSKVSELLKCSAELLGKGSVGTTYKVVMDGGDAVVVKRVREKRRRRGEVDGWSRLIGGLRHGNVVSLKAYYNSMDELLLVYDYMPNGSLHSLLHGNRGPWRTPLDWTKRLNLALGAAQGLAFLHCYNKAKLFHGHLTSSNIIVDQMGNACISDIGLHQLLHTPSSSKDAYIAPELVGNNSGSQRRITQKCDVYSFGVILLEILTGKMVTEEEEETSLVEWVRRVGREELTGEVFDIELLSYKEMEEEMVALLQVALLCLAPLPKDRPKMSMIHRMIEDIKKKGVSEGRENFIMNELSSDSSESTPKS